MTEDEQIEEFLEHFGVKGMKWGIRNKNPALSRKTSKAYKQHRTNEYRKAGFGILKSKKWGRWDNDDRLRMLKGAELVKKFISENGKMTDAQLRRKLTLVALRHPVREGSDSWEQLFGDMHLPSSR